jgi:hypothetical protein
MIFLKFILNALALIIIPLILIHYSLSRSLSLITQNTHDNISHRNQLSIFTVQDVRLLILFTTIYTHACFAYVRNVLLMSTPSLFAFTRVR